MIVFFLPSRINSTVAVEPGSVAATASASSMGSLVARSFQRTITSPGLMPAAAAGELRHDGGHHGAVGVGQSGLFGLRRASAIVWRPPASPSDTLPEDFSVWHTFLARLLGMAKPMP